ncbi:unnamed protein product [Pleuronectes platessa]|uniref:Uncharacterized protein n=1 Tax=Pleuronectes platessa TaxID=8262 RepID=A0A9N7V8T8_PLEPL|nr:unnamed protein product [Pleuronectes platessa]
MRVDRVGQQCQLYQTLTRKDKATTDETTCWKTVMQPEENEQKHRGGDRRRGLLSPPAGSLKTEPIEVVLNRGGNAAAANPRME